MLPLHPTKKKRQTNFDSNFTVALPIRKFAKRKNMFFLNFNGITGKVEEGSAPPLSVSRYNR